MARHMFRKNHQLSLKQAWQHGGHKALKVLEKIRHLSTIASHYLLFL